jgi:D-alanyl-D-alanine carboxypeptidase
LHFHSFSILSNLDPTRGGSPFCQYIQLSGSVKKNGVFVKFAPQKISAASFRFFVQGSCQFGLWYHTKMKRAPLDYLDYLNDAVVRGMAKYRTPALALALIDRNGILFSGSYGYADLACTRPVQPDTLFNIGSLGKIFTALLLLQASEEGRLLLDDPVNCYLSWFQPGAGVGATITLRHLLHHTAGLPQGFDSEPGGLNEIYNLAQIPLAFPPGEQFYYSNTGYKVLGLVLESVYGQPYAEIARKAILEPLEMHNSAAAVTADLRPRMPVGLRPLLDDRPTWPDGPLVPAEWMPTTTGDGCIAASLGDLANFASMLLNRGEFHDRRLIAEDNWQSMISPGLPGDLPTGYGLGLELYRERGYRLAGHGGDAPGYEAYLWLDLDNGLGVVEMEAVPHLPRLSFFALDLLRAVRLGLAWPQPAFLAQDSLELPNAAEFNGVYERCEPTGPDFQVTRLEIQGDAALQLHWTDEKGAAEQAALVVAEEDSFLIDHPGWALFPLQFGRAEGEWGPGPVIELFYGPHWFVNPAYQGPRQFAIPSRWLAYSGHYLSFSPYLNSFRVFVRKGQLVFCLADGRALPLEELAEGEFRIADEEYVAERLRFDNLAGGRALRALLSGAPFSRVGVG